MLDPRFRGDDKCAEHPSVTEALPPWICAVAYAPLRIQD